MLRVGLLNPQYNSYGQWKHLCCWRVSQKMYKMLPDDLDDDDAVLTAVKRAENVAFASDGLTDKDLLQIAEWVSDPSNWANHNAEGVCVRGGEGRTAPMKKRPAADEFEALAALDKGLANADELGLDQAAGPITPEKAKKKAKKAVAA